MHKTLVKVKNKKLSELVENIINKMSKNEILQCVQSESSLLAPQFRNPELVMDLNNAMLEFLDSPILAGKNKGEISATVIKVEGAYKALKHMIKKDVKLASIPGGYYSEKVKKSAIESGINFLFTSEPEKKVRKQNDILLIGRFPIMYNSSENYPFQLFVSRRARISVQTLWKLKKFLKMLPFNFYLHVREMINSLRFGWII